MVLKVTLVLVILGIAYLSLTPLETITVGNDKISHFIAYGILMTNVGFLTYSDKSKFVKGIVLSLVYGATIELGQHFVPGRFMSLGDMLANTIGVFFGVCITLILYKPLEKVLKSARII